MVLMELIKGFGESDRHEDSVYQWGKHHQENRIDEWCGYCERPSRPAESTSGLAIAGGKDQCRNKVEEKVGYDSKDHGRGDGRPL